MLHASELIVRRGGKRIIDEVSMSIIGGELVALMGPSDAGKSTLMGVLAGDIKPSGGSVWMGGKPMEQWTLRERALRRAVLPQLASLTSPLDAFDVVRSGRAPHIAMTESRQDRDISEAALRWVQAEELRDRPYSTLSGGERQRVHLARVLAQIWARPPQGDCYVFLDEPTIGLDLVHQHLMMNVAREVANDGAAVILVLHDLNLAAQYCDRLLLLRAGKLHSEGHPRTLLTPPTISRVFGMDVHVIPHPSHDCPLVIPAIVPTRSSDVVA